jgi:hypothetical protein
VKPAVMNDEVNTQTLEDKEKDKIKITANK